VKVSPIEGEPTCFIVESRTFQCDYCAKMFPANVKLIVGQTCSHCNDGILKRTIPHKVDVSRLFPVGECACKGFQLQRRKVVVGMKPSVRLQLSFYEQERLRCVHIKAARCFCLNRELWKSELERLKSGNGRNEE